MAIVPNQSELVGPRLGAWQAELKHAIRDPYELCRELKLPESVAENAIAAAQEFSLFAPRPFVQRIEPGNPNDPLLLQLLPVADELQSPSSFLVDPVGDQAATIAPGVIHKYQGRTLLIATGVCAINCRYCFRRSFPYQDAPTGSENWNRSLQAVRDDQTIEELILSGGDPLLLNDENLARLVDQIAAIEHVQRLRIHTRLPIMIPSRVTEGLIRLLKNSRLLPVVVVHCNHARELDEAVAAAFARLVDSGALLLNQSVLLRGINDHAKTLVDLSRRLINLRVTPYYLHQLDRVQGAAHFEVPIDRGKELIREVRRQLPGYAVPRYVVEITGENSKTILA